MDQSVINLISEYTDLSEQEIKRLLSLPPLTKSILRRSKPKTRDVDG